MAVWGILYIKWFPTQSTSCRACSILYWSNQHSNHDDTYDSSSFLFSKSLEPRSFIMLCKNYLFSPFVNKDCYFSSKSYSIDQTGIFTFDGIFVRPRGINFPGGFWFTPNHSIRWNGIYHDINNEDPKQIDVIYFAASSCVRPKPALSSKHGPEALPNSEMPIQTYFAFGDFEYLRYLNLSFR